MSRKRNTARAGLVIMAGTLSTACLGAGAAAAQELPTPLPTQSLPPLPLPTSPAPQPSTSPSDDPTGGLPVPLPTGSVPNVPGDSPDPPDGGTPTSPDSDTGSTTAPRPKSSNRPPRHASTSADLSRAGGFGYAAPPAFGALKVGSYFDSGVPGLGLPSVARWAPAAQGPGYAPVTAGGEQAPLVASQVDPVATDTALPLSHRNLLLAIGFTLVAGVATAHFKVAQLAEPQAGRHRTTS